MLSVRVKRTGLWMTGILCERMKVRVGGCVSDAEGKSRENWVVDEGGSNNVGGTTVMMIMVVMHWW